VGTPEKAGKGRKRPEKAGKGRKRPEKAGKGRKIHFELAHFTRPDVMTDEGASFS